MDTRLTASESRSQSPLGMSHHVTTENTTLMVTLEAFITLQEQAETMQELVYDLQDRVGILTQGLTDVS